MSCVLASCLVIASCTSIPSTSERDVFAVATGFSTTMPDRTREIIDIGIYPLRNLTGTAVRLISVSFANAPREVHTLNVHAYNYDHTRDVPLGAEGDLPVECPAQYVPHDVGSFVTPAHSDTPWFIVIEFTISKPGRYYLGRLMLRYETGGHKGWQYQNINATVIVKNPPLPGPRPVPASAACG
jgi:hypothetical protein